jgi:hypothetical protein
MGQKRRDLSDVRVAHGHTLASIKLSTLGKWLVLAVMLTVSGVILGTPGAPFALAAFAVIAVVCLLISAFKRNLARWRRRAALGLDPQSIGTATLTAVMALEQMLPGVEDYAIRRAEETADREEVDRLAMPRTARTQHDAQSTCTGGVKAPAGPDTARIAASSNANFSTTTLH